MNYDRKVIFEINCHDPTFIDQKVVSLIRKKGIEREKKRRKKETTSESHTAERINYINNKSITQYTTLIRVIQHIHHILDSYKHLSRHYNSNTYKTLSQRSTQRNYYIYIYNAEASCSIAPPEKLVKAKPESLGYS